DLAVVRCLRVGADRDELVGAIAHPIDAERPDVDVVLLPLDQPREIGRVAGLVREERAGYQHHGHEHCERKYARAVAHGILRWRHERGASPRTGKLVALSDPRWWQRQCALRRASSPAATGSDRIRML